MIGTSKFGLHDLYYKIPDGLIYPTVAAFRSLVVFNSDTEKYEWKNGVNPVKAEQKNGNVGDFSLVQFNTEEEQINITDFLYGDQGFKFMTKILTCMNADSYCNVSRFLPKVDWTKGQTSIKRS